MKRLVIFALAAVTLLFLTGCGGGGGEQSQLPEGTWGESSWSQVRWGP